MFVHGTVGKLAPLLCNQLPTKKDKNDTVLSPGKDHYNTTISRVNRHATPCPDGASVQNRFEAEQTGVTSVCLTPFPVYTENRVWIADTAKQVQRACLSESAEQSRKMSFCHSTTHVPVKDGWIDSNSSALALLLKNTHSSRRWIAMVKQVFFF